MPKIHTYSISTALSWTQQGLQLYKKQFVRLSILFIAISMAISISSALPIIGIFLGLVSLPLSHMLLFNAAYGVRLRGHFMMNDLAQKLKTSQVWSRLLLASLLNLSFVYVILSLTLPTLPISAEAFMNLSSAEMSQIILETYQLEKLLPSIISLFVYLMLSVWVYPLITWEDSKVIPAFMNSFKASAVNLLPLIGFSLIFILITVMAHMLLGNFVLAIFPSAYTMTILFIINTVVVSFYMTLFTAYMEIFYGKTE